MVNLKKSTEKIDNISVIIKEQGVSRKGVQIHDDCWIGAGATILDGVVLKTRTVVAAGSVVTKSFESNSIIGGIPAKTLKSISESFI